MKVSEQCGISASMGEKLLNEVGEMFYNETARITPLLYKTITRPHLE